jgi:glyoxylase-like metal-dependent hydrolase (beta-lactamase superfamily II)
MQIRIEDEYEDVLAKAMAGLNFDADSLATNTGISAADIDAVLAGNYDETIVRALSKQLRLDAVKLIRLAAKNWSPPEHSCTGLQIFNTPFPVPGYEEMTVNSYLVWDTTTRVGCMFDTGANISQLLDFVKANGITIESLFLTHTHHDHIAAFDEVVKVFPAIVTHAPLDEPFANANPVAHLETYQCSGLSIEARLTNGHSPGGTCYVISGLERPVAIVGDSIFCLSMGGAANAYEQALKNNTEQLLSLPENTLLCPGHGPITTVENELERNPFF